MRHMNLHFCMPLTTHQVLFCVNRFVGYGLKALILESSLSVFYGQQKDFIKARQSL